MFDISAIHASTFYELTTLICLSAIVGFIGMYFRQPMIVSFIVVGIISGPSMLDIVQSHDHIGLLADIGIAILLFLVGLKLDLNLIKTLGPVALATGIGQIVFTTVVGFLIGILLGLDVIVSLYVAIALTFSSTIIIVKLLSDKREVDSLHGRIAIGFLIVQDIAVVFAMMLLSSIGVGTSVDGNVLSATKILTILGNGALLLLFILFFIRYVANSLIGRMASSPEILVTFAIGWATLLAAIGDQIGFSKELGGLLAGVSLAGTPFRETIVGRLGSLRDFLLLFFFIALGAQLNFMLFHEQVIPAIIFSLFVLIGNPLIVMVIMGLLGYKKRTSFLAGLTVAQISEFSLIFISMGLKLGHVSTESLSLVTLVGVITISTSVYMIMYSQRLYQIFEPFLDIFERNIKYPKEFQENTQVIHYDVILFGLGRYGKAFSQQLMKEGFTVLAVDFNPSTVKFWQDKGHKAVYGDIFDFAFIESLSLQNVQWVISTIPYHDVGITHEDPRLALIDALKSSKYTGNIAVSAQYSHEDKILLDKGATIIFKPFSDAAKRAVELIIQASKIGAGF